MKFKAQAAQDLKEIILGISELVVLTKDSRPLTSLYVRTCACGELTTELKRYEYWLNLRAFCGTDSVLKLSSSLAQKYLGSLWYLDHFIRHNGMKNPQYRLKAEALQLELDESFDFFEFAYSEGLIPTKTYDNWGVADNRSRPLLESVLA